MATTTPPPPTTTSLTLSNFLSFLSPSTNPKSPPQLLSLKPKSHYTPLVTPTTGISRVSAVGGGELGWVMNPAAANANTLFFRSAYNVQVIVDDNEPEEKLLNRFRREVMRAGVIQECKRRRFFENKQDEKKRKSREAAKRNRRRRPQARTMTPMKQEGSTKKDEDDEDNWDMPDEDDIPYQL